MHEINEKRERLGEYHRLCVELQSRTFSINFFFSGILPPLHIARLANLSPKH